MDILKFVRIIAGIALLGLATIANALPTLTFGGTVDYSSSSGLLSVSGQLLSSQSIIPQPDFASSSVYLSTTFSSVTSANNVTVGTFGSGTITVSDNSGSLLTGSFTLAQMGGLDGGTLGALTLVFSPTGGSLYPYFSDPSDVFALTLNLSTSFSASMYSTSFSGIGNGNISSRTAVSEPGIISLLVVGLGLVGVTGLHRRRWVITAADKR